MDLFGYQVSEEVITCVILFVIICIGLYFFYMYKNEPFGNIANYAPAMTTNYLYYNKAPYLQNNTGYDSATRGYYNYNYAKQVAQNLH